MTTIAQNEELLKHLADLLDKCRQVVPQQRIYERIKALVFGELLALGRHTLTQILMALGLTQEDWTAWYRIFSHGRWSEATQHKVLLQACLEALGPEELLVVGGDGTQTPRTSAKVEGVGYLVNHRTPPFQRGIHLAQRWFHGALFLPPEQGFSRALPLRWLPAFTAKAQHQITDPQREWEAAHVFLRDLRTDLSELGRAQQRILFVGDGSYDTVAFWKGLPTHTTALTRSAKNRALRHLPPVPKHGNRKYGTKASTPQQFWQEREGWSTCQLTLRGHSRQLRYRVEGPFLREGAPNCPLFLLIVGGETYLKNGREKHREPVPYLVNAVQTAAGDWVLPLAIPDLLFWAWQRWELEVVHRELKSQFGLGEKQCWEPHAAVSSVQWSAWVYALLILAGYRTWGLTRHPQTPTAWWRGGQRWSFNTLLRHYRAALGGGHTFHASWFTIQDNLPEKIPSWLDVRHTLYGSVRL